MNVILLIDGLEAISVRAMPFITGGRMSPINVAASLANIDLTCWLQINIEPQTRQVCDYQASCAVD